VNRSFRGRNVNLSIIKSAALIALLGCATATYTVPRPLSDPIQYERVVGKSYDDTWTSLVDYTSRAFFGIDRFEKASGLMTLTFGSSDPARFIDCGHFAGERLGQSLDVPYARYLHEKFGAKLDGKMNLVVRSVDAKSTLVRVNSRYIFTVPPNPNIAPSVQTWTFDSGGEATVTVARPTPGTIATRTCRPTYVAERAILDAVAK
jgi:hypothetical protein